MKCVTALSDLYGLYVKKSLPKRDFEGLIFKYLLDNFERYRVFNGDRDRWSEFLSWLYPRLSRAIDLYRDLGSSFDAYIYRLVRCAVKEYRSRESEHYVTEYICWRAKAEEMVLYESEPEYSEASNDPAIPPGVSSRQILILLLKSYHFVSDEFVKRIAKVIGMDAALVQGMIDELRLRRFEKELELYELRERVHSQHYRCLTYEKRMNDAPLGTVYYNKMLNRLERARKRYQCMKKRLGGIRMAPSNRILAEILGMPRGTVDSSLSALKNRLTSIAE